MRNTFISDLFEKPVHGWAGDIAFDCLWVKSNKEVALSAIGFCFDNITDFIIRSDCQRVSKGIECIFNNSCSDLAYLFIDKDVDLKLKIDVIKSLAGVIDNLYGVYCKIELDEIGSDVDGYMGSICYMLWDITPVYPPNIEPELTDACIGIIKHSIGKDNESCIVSGLHGLGHWTMHRPELPNLIKDDLLCNGGH